jgi:3-dehydroquinate synthase
MMFSPIVIRSNRGEYPVNFYDDFELLCEATLDSKATIVVLDESIQRIYEKRLEPLVGSAETFVIHSSESEKTLDGCTRLLEHMAARNANRDTVVLAIGGGVLQDIVTFAAHVYFRGIAWHFVPTTLLAMADSCIGAKASINFSGFKNQLGVYHSPSMVSICVAFTKSLDDTALLSGLGEIVKLHLAGPETAFDELVETIANRGLRSPELSKMVYRSLRIKQGYIEQDEFDNGVRRHLNYGHTFGHALESITDHAVPHGIAIAIGMDLVNYISLKRGLLSSSIYRRIHEFLARTFAFSIRGEIRPEDWIAPTKRDKKSKDGKLRLVLLRKPGELELVEQENASELFLWVSEYCNSQMFLRTKIQIN